MTVVTPMRTIDNTVRETDGILVDLQGMWLKDSAVLAHEDMTFWELPTMHASPMVKLPRQTQG